MNSDKPTEHYVTLFDSHYLPQGLCLYRSLEEHGRPFHLWIVAVDEACATALGKLQLGQATVVRLQEVENDALRSVKPDRSVAEYCWTLTPFLPSYVFSRRLDIERVTYIDADLFFFQSPVMLIDEFLASGKHVLMTEHAFAPEREADLRYGRFCVQFMTFRNSEPARGILADWQQRCVAWCYAREEDGKFGDQKYLDDWPRDYPSDVHILTRTDRTLAPWNVAYFSRVDGTARPTFFHFQSLKIVSKRKVVLYFMYRIGRRNRWIYDCYLSALRSAIREMQSRDIPLVARPKFTGWRRKTRYAWEWLFGRAASASLERR